MKAVFVLFWRHHESSFEHIFEPWPPWQSFLEWCRLQFHGRWMRIFHFLGRTGYVRRFGQDECITPCAEHTCLEDVSLRQQMLVSMMKSRIEILGISALPGKARGYSTCPLRTGGGTTAFAKGLLCGSIAAVSGGCFEMFRWKGWWLSGCDPWTKSQSYYKNWIMLQENGFVWRWGTLIHRNCHLGPHYMPETKVIPPCQTRSNCRYLVIYGYITIDPYIHPLWPSTISSSD